MKKSIFFFILLTLLFSPILAHPQEMESKWKDVKIITTDELKKLYDSKADFMLFNALSPIEYAEERIKGSTNMPYMYMKSGKGKLPADKNKMLVFYCKGPK